MPIIRDPRGEETNALDHMIDFTNLQVLEVGCGDGRLTQHYADRAAHVTAIDPDQDAITTARDNLPQSPNRQVEFIAADIEAYSPPQSQTIFDAIILSHSL